MSIRTKGDKIGMWLGDSNAGESIITVGKKLKERLNIDALVSHLKKIVSQKLQAGKIPKIS